MARAIRLAFEDAVYHLCARGNRREKVFLSENDYLQFEKLLADSVERYQVELQAYVLLPNHFHLLARTLKPNVSRWMHWLIMNYCGWFNRRHQLVGHVFQGRYKAFVVQDGSYALELSRYLHLNPVRGTALGGGTPVERRTRLRSYKWSSYRGYAGIAKQKAFVREDLVFGELGDCRTTHADKIKYRGFVEEGLLREVKNPFEQVRWQSLLGDEAFVRQMRDALQSKREQARELAGARHVLQPAQPTELIDRVAQHYRITREALLEQRLRGSDASNVAMWLLRKQSGLSLREIGSLFGGMDYGAVSERIRRVNRDQAKEKRLRRSCEILNIET